MKYILPILILLTGAASAEECYSRKAILDALKQEKVTAVGLTNVGALIELLTSDDGETWTIIYTKPNGMSCLVASGSYWLEREEPKPTY